jgi:hypothetical protein
MRYLGANALEKNPEAILRISTLLQHEGNENSRLNVRKTVLALVNLYATRSEISERNYLTQIYLFHHIYDKFQ